MIWGCLLFLDCKNKTEETLKIQKGKYNKILIKFFTKNF